MKPHGHVYALALVICGSAAAARAEPTHAWIFSGQSNMKAIGAQARQAVGEVVESHGHEFFPVYVAEPGKPIEGWLDPEHNDYGKLWRQLEVKINDAKGREHEFRGFVWYQGESDVNREAGKYQQQLAELVSRIRELTAEPRLPVIVVQIGAATGYDGQDWAVGVVREAQRRFVVSDGHAALVTAIDAEIGDYAVHLSRNGADTVAKRIAAAADRLAYGNGAAHWGPQFATASFADETRRQVLVYFSDVQDELRLADGWLAGFGASTKAKLPAELGDLQDAGALGRLTDDFLYPTAGTSLGNNAVVLQFGHPLPADACISYAPMRNAQYGPHRRWGLEFGGPTDASGQQAPAFTLAHIAPGARPISIPELKPSASIHSQWQQIAVNCVGRCPEAVTAADVKAGFEQDRWRQPYWNAVSAGQLPNLIDSEGRVTPVGFHTGVWYMSPYFRQLDDADDALMASWCKNSTHGYFGLTPGRKYDLAIYLLQGPPNNVGERHSHRLVKVSVLHIPSGKGRKHATPVKEQLMRVPATGTFDEYEVVSAGDDSAELQGNVLLMSNLVADEEGRIDLAVEIAQRRGDAVQWSDTTLSAVQIRATTPNED